MLKLKRNGDILEYKGKHVMVMDNLDDWDYDPEATEFWIKLSTGPGTVETIVFASLDRSRILIDGHWAFIPLIIEREVFDLDINMYESTAISMELWYA